MRLPKVNRPGRNRDADSPYHNVVRPYLRFSPLLLASAAEPPPKLRPSFYREVIPHTTGRNGYEELTMAAELVLNYPQSTGGVVPLPERREIVRSPQSGRIFGLIRRGLAKPVSLPPTRKLRSRLQELEGFRRCARLLNMRFLVELADGERQAAASTLREILGLGSAIRTGALLHYLTGTSVTSVGITAAVRNLDRYSARDCELLFDVCREALGRPARMEGAISGELRLHREVVADLLNAAARGDAAGAARLVGLNADSAAEVKHLFQGVAPKVLEKLRREAAETLDHIEEFQLKQARLAPWERARQKDAPSAPDLVKPYLDLIEPSWDYLIDFDAEDTAELRLLAVHLMLRRFWWEWREYPDHLTDLHAPEITIDPFTGRPLLYERMDGSYRLRSAGPEAGPDDIDDSRTENGRRPIDIVR